MRNPIFYFKQFAVDQTDCAMKINTDGVLLGVLAEHIQPKRIIDVGAGTGVIGLMLAQKYPEAQVWGVEIEAQAAQRAQQNFAQSPFASRLHLLEQSIAGPLPLQEVDLMVSNPPFFKDSLHNPQLAKKLARHDDGHFLPHLLKQAQQLLHIQGQLWLILPAFRFAQAIELALDMGLYLQKQWLVYSFAEDKNPVRIIGCFGRRQEPTVEASLVLYAEKGVYTEAYRSALQPYFLAY
jgi:tRNA1Val (adenine37-N6)-methyltransferase